MKLSDLEQMIERMKEEAGDTDPEVTVHFQHNWPLVGTLSGWTRKSENLKLGTEPSDDDDDDQAEAQRLADNPEEDYFILVMDQASEFDGSPYGTKDSWESMERI